MRKYTGNLSSSEFLKNLNSIMGNIGNNFEMCVMCTHHNGECVDFARQGKCGSYNKYGKNFTENNISEGE
jgi:hypothetical protein